LKQNDKKTLERPGVEQSYCRRDFDVAGLCYELGYGLGAWVMRGNSLWLLCCLGVAGIGRRNSYLAAVAAPYPDRALWPSDNRNRADLDSFN